MSHGPESRPQAAEQDGLARLIETEARIAEVLAGARAEASSLIRSAREDATADEGRFEEQLARDLAGVSARVTARRDEEMNRLASAAEARARSLRELPESVVDELAGWVVRRICAAPGRPA
jgi:hypothetical protein